MSVMIVSYEESARFDRAIQSAAKRAAALNPVKLKPRHSSVVKSQIERAKLASTRVRKMIEECSQALENAKTILAEANSKLKQLRDAGFRDNSSEVQKLTGFNFSSRVSETPLYYPGTIARCEELIDTEGPRLKSLQQSLEREEERLNSVVLPPLQLELEQALAIERVS